MSLDEDQRRRVEALRRRCSKCGEFFPDEATMRDHWYGCDASGFGLAVCKNCGKKFNRNDIGDFNRICPRPTCRDERGRVRPKVLE